MRIVLSESGTTGKPGAVRVFESKGLCHLTIRNTGSASLVLLVGDEANINNVRENIGLEIAPTDGIVTGIVVSGKFGLRSAGSGETEAELIISPCT